MSPPPSAISPLAAGHPVDGFGASCLRAAGLGELARAAMEHEAFATKDALRAARLELPLLLKLVELSVGRTSFEIKPRAVIGARIEDLHTRTTEERLRSSHGAAIVLDGWTRTTDLERDLETLRHIRISMGLACDGPTTGELISIATQHGSELRDVISLCARSGIDRIRGPHLEVHEQTSGARSEIISVIAPSAPEELVAHIDDVRERIPEAVSWEPACSARLDVDGAADAPLGVDLFRAIAVARLMLPSVPIIRAPLKIFGLKAAQVALLCGANDTGDAAVDGFTERLFNLTSMEVVLAQSAPRGVASARLRKRASNNGTLPVFQT